MRMQNFSFDICLFNFVAVENIILKIQIYRWHLQIKDLTDHLFLDWDILKSREEYVILKKYAENGRWYSLTYACK